jgi:hypothetical protein
MKSIVGMYARATVESTWIKREMVREFLEDLF